MQVTDVTGVLFAQWAASRMGSLRVAVRDTCAVWAVTGEAVVGVVPKLWVESFHLLQGVRGAHVRVGDVCGSESEALTTCRRLFVADSSTGLLSTESCVPFAAGDL